MSPETTTVLQADPEQESIPGSLDEAGSGINRSGEQTVSTEETVNDDWDRAFTALVAENANVIIESPRLPGVKIPFGAAMLMCQGRLTPENVHMYYAEGLQLLANRVAETDEEKEPQEDDSEEDPIEEAEEPDQKSATKPKTSEPQKKSKNSEDIRSKEETFENRSPEPSVTSAKKTDLVKTPVAESNNHVFHAKELAPSSAEKVPASVGWSENFTETASGGRPAANEASAGLVSPSEAVGSEFATSEVGAGLTLQANFGEAPSAQGPKLSQAEKLKAKVKEQVAKEPLAIGDVANPEVEAEPTLDSRPSTTEEAEPLDLTLESQLSIESEPADLPLFDAEAIVDLVEMEGELTAEIENESTSEPFDYLADGDMAIDFTEGEEIWLEHFEPTNLELDEPQTLSSESVTRAVKITEEAGLTSPFNVEPSIEQAPIRDTEQLAQVGMALSEVEDALNQLAERTKTSEPQTAEKVNEILDKIVEVPARLETEDEETIATTAQAEEELEELFTQLLLELDINYTPELIKSFVNLTLRQQLADEIANIKTEQDTEPAPQDRGTHEIIKKLLAAVNNVKQAAQRAYHIGKSVLWLYSRQLAPA